MKFLIYIASLAMALTMASLRADEPKASAPMSLGKNKNAKASTPAEAKTSTPPDDRDEASATSDSTQTETTTSQPSKPRRLNTSDPNRKVAKDYAPAQDLLLSAMGLIGVKYKWGGNTPESGLDCSGFVRYVFQNSLNIVLPRTALNMSRMGDNIEKEELKPGDLVFFNTLKRQFSHVGIYLGDNRFIHSPRKGRTVEVANMEDRYWTTRFNGGRRMSDLDHETVDIEALLQGRPARAPSAASASESRNCRKITRVKKGKKIVTTVCARSTSKAVKTIKRNGKASNTASASKPTNKKPVKKIIKKRR